MSTLRRLPRKLSIEELEPRVAPAAAELSKLGVLLSEVIQAYNDGQGLGNIAPPAGGSITPSPTVNAVGPPAPIAPRLEASADPASSLSSAWGDLVTIRNAQILVDVFSDQDVAAATSQLRGLGMDVTATARAGNQNVIEGFVPISKIADLTGLSSVSTIAAALKPQSAAGIVTTQADVVERANLARTLGADGTGVTVGVLSDSVNVYGGGIASSQATGDLPDSSHITVVADGPAGSTDEGRAIMEVVHDLAPGADLAFHTAFNGEADFANGITELAGIGAKVIADDVFYYDEPFFQDGIVAQAVTQVTSGGAAYFSAAGNMSNKSYEAPYRGVYGIVNGYFGNWHDFDPGPGIDPLQQITLPANSVTVIGLQWDDPWYTTGGVQSDLDFAMFYGTSLVAVSVADNMANNQPFEIIGVQNTGSVPVPVDLAITMYTGTRVPQDMKYVIYNYRATIDQYATNSPTIGNHAAAAGGIGVAASPYWNPTVPESYSSQGPETVLFDPYGNRLATPQVRNAPQLTATDGGNTSFFYPGSYDVHDGPDAFPNFYGTSAAVPGAAAVAALIWSGAPTLTNTQVYQIMENTAHDMGAPGFDNTTGYGLVDAYNAVRSVTVPGIRVASLNSGQVILYDTDAADLASADVKPSDVSVRKDFGGNVTGVWITGNSTGLGLIVKSTSSSPVTITDSRAGVGTLRSLSFIASATPIKQISVRSDMSGVYLGQTLRNEGLTVGLDLDADGNIYEPTAIYDSGYIGVLQVQGGLNSGDVIAAGVGPSGYGLQTASIGGNVIGSDIVTRGAVSGLTLGGSFQDGSLTVGGSAGLIQVNGPISDSVMAIAGSVGTMTFNGVLDDSHVSVTGSGGRMTFSRGLSDGSSVYGAQGATAIWVGNGINASAIQVNGNVADLRICGILTNSSLVSISGQVQTIAVYGAPGGPTVSANSTLRIGSLRTVLNLTGELAGTIDITGTAQSSQIHILGNLSGSLLAGLFGNVTIMGRFTGIIGDAGTAAGKGNTLIVTMRGGGGIVAPAKAFANYFGYP